MKKDQCNECGKVTMCEEYIDVAGDPCDYDVVLCDKCAVERGLK